MEHEKLNFAEAVLRIAHDHNIEVPKVEEGPEELEKWKHIEGLRITNDLACHWFEEQLKVPEHKGALDYVLSRWSRESIAQFRIGFAPEGWDNLKKWSEAKGIRQDMMIEAGLLQESKGKVFDYFRNRIIFPILDARGRVSGFTGRDISNSDEARKYFNTHETDAYHKGELLYGMNFARRSAKERDRIHLVEGNPDVIRLHEIGIANTVGTSGTALTPEQIKSIKAVCGSVTIIGDSDKAGRKAVERSGDMLLMEGVFVNIVEMPVWCPIEDYLVNKGYRDTKDLKEEKTDPDSFFRTKDQFDAFVTARVKDYILWKANQYMHKAKNPDMKSKLVDQISAMIARLKESSHEMYIEQLSRIIKPKKVWSDALKAIKREQVPEKDEGWKIPDDVLLSDFEKYGFYIDNNCYYFKTSKGVLRGTNFTMEPLFHISSVLNAKRLFRITNEFKFTQVIELAQKDMISLSAFRLRVESLGNFLFEGGEPELNRLKRYLYEKTDSCYEIAQLGWQSKGFWAWCNGIYTDQFVGTDDNGIVRFNDENFYLPASSKVYQGEDTLFVSERRFRHNPSGKITLFDYSTKLIEVFGENAMFGICFYMTSLFRDYIARLFGFFPILNLFGPKGAGKTEMAISLIQFFGNQSKGPNMTNTTKPALADHVAMFSNACCHLDEYKNNMEYEKIEFLKGLWDGTGRTRMNMDKDRKKETTHVDCGIILSGQEMPTADIALFSRLVFLSFTKVEYSDFEKTVFNELKEMEKTGLTHITHELLSYRQHFIDHFFDEYNAVSKRLTSLLDRVVIEDRIFRNWTVLLAGFSTLEQKVKLPFGGESFYKKAVELIIRQNVETKKSNELSIFWSIIEFLSNDGLIREEVDYKIEFTDRLKTDSLNVEWKQPKNVLYINHSRLFQLYRVHGAKTKENILPLKTLEYYLQNCKEYLGTKKSVAFKIEMNGRIMEDVENPLTETLVKRRITTAMVFEYDSLGINMTTSMVKKEDDAVKVLPF